MTKLIVIFIMLMAKAFLMYVVVDLLMSTYGPVAAVLGMMVFVLASMIATAALLESGK